MKKNVQETFEKVVEEYISFLKIFYPGKKSAGFNEVNQVSKFLHYYKMANPCSLVWLELSFGGSDGRMDGLIIDHQRDAVVFIEAKRMSDPRKIDAISDDLARACDAKNRNKLLYDEKQEKLLSLKNHYALLLVDIWDESSYKHNRIIDWCKDSSIKTPLNAELITNYISEPLMGKYHLAYSLYKIKNKL